MESGILGPRMSSPSKRAVLETLSVKRLGGLCDAFSIERARTARKDDLVETLHRARSAPLETILGKLSRDELKAVCRALGLDDGGVAREPIVARILGRAPAQVPLPNTAPPPSPSSSQARSPAPEVPAAAPAPAPAPATKPRSMPSETNLSSFLWSVADLLRGDYKQSGYGKVILPFTVLRRLDCVLESTKEAVLAEKALREKAGLNPEPFLLRKSGQLFFNTSPLDLPKLTGDQDHIGENLRSYIRGFSAPVRDIFDRFDFHTQIDRLAKAGLLYLVTEKFANIDLHPKTVSNAQMGQVFEELIRKFAELSNETAGEHFTPREVIKLMVNLLFIEDDDALTQPGVVRSIYDPTAGTGGMLSVAEEHLKALNPAARLVIHGQELNPESYAICKADMLIKGQDIANIVFGNTLDIGTNTNRR